MSNPTRHPLHISVLESFAELREAPNQQQASFTATLSRILTDAFLASDPECHMPAFLVDRGVQILRLAIDDMDSDTAPAATQAIGQMIGAYHNANAFSEGLHVAVRSGGFALCAPFASLEEMLKDETLRAGGSLGFFDPIYEDSLILIQVSHASQADWHLRLSDDRGNLAAVAA